MTVAPIRREEDKRLMAVLEKQPAAVLLRVLEITLATFGHVTISSTWLSRRDVDGNILETTEGERPLPLTEVIQGSFAIALKEHSPPLLEDPKFVGEMVDYQRQEVAAIKRVLAEAEEKLARLSSSAVDLASASAVDVASARRTVAELTLYVEVRKAGVRHLETLLESLGG
jgi:hypothetical protein